jgi:hypothetical protein
MMYALSTPKMITVRISVAISESTPARPIMAKIAVSAANTAQKSAQVNLLEERTMVAMSDPYVDL